MASSIDSQWDRFFFNKDHLELVSSLFWFLMDASWMFELNSLALIFVFPTVVTGALLVLLEKNPSFRWVNLAVLFWMIMNAGWLASEILGDPDLLIASKVSFVLGVLSLFQAVRLQKSQKGLALLLAHFRRFRLGKSSHFKQS